MRKGGDGILRKDLGRNVKTPAPSSPLLERLPRFLAFTQRPEDADGSVRTINISAIPMRRERVSDGEQSTGTETGDGRERCER